MILYMFQCHSPKSFHPLPLPQSPQDCSIHQCLFCWTFIKGVESQYSLWGIEFRASDTFRTCGAGDWRSRNCTQEFPSPWSKPALHICLMKPTLWGLTESSMHKIEDRMAILEGTRCRKMFKIHRQWRDLINTSGIQVSYQKGHKLYG